MTNNNEKLLKRTCILLKYKQLWVKSDLHVSSHGDCTLCSSSGSSSYDAMSKLCNICRTLTVYNTGTASALFSSAQSSCCHCHTLSTAHSRSRANVHPHCSISSKITASQANMYEFKCWKWFKNGISVSARHFLNNMHGVKLLNNTIGNVRTM